MVSFTASFNNQSLTSINQLWVEPPPHLKSLSLSPTSANPATNRCVNGEMVLDEAVPSNSGGVVVSLSSSNPRAASVPATVTVPWPGPTPSSGSLSPTTLGAVR